MPQWRLPWVSEDIFTLSPAPIACTANTLSMFSERWEGHVPAVRLDGFEMCFHVRLGLLVLALALKCYLFSVGRVDDIEDNSKLRRGIPGKSSHMMSRDIT